MNKKDCKIVRDLLPSYIEELASNDSKEFIENHLKECKECEKVLETMRKGEHKAKNKKKEEDKKEIDFLKKYHQKFNEIKGAFILLVVGLICIGGFKFAKESYDYKLGEQNHNIIAKAYQSTMEDREKQENLELIIEGNLKYPNGGEGKNTVKRYYKDGRSKTENYKDEEIRQTVYTANIYGEKQYRWAYVYVDFTKQNDVKLMSSADIIVDENEYRPYDERIEGGGFNFFKVLKQFYEIGIKESKDINIKEETKNEKNYYIARIGNNTNYLEIWINKENMILEKEIFESKEYGWEHTFTWNTGVVEDKDVLMTEVEEENAEHNIICLTKLYEESKLRDMSRIFKDTNVFEKELNELKYEGLEPITEN